MDNRHTRTALKRICEKTYCVWILPFGLFVFSMFYLGSNVYPAPKIIKTTCFYTNPTITDTSIYNISYYTLYCTIKSANYTLQQEIYQGADIITLIDSMQTCMGSSSKCYIVHDKILFKKPRQT